MKQAAMVLLLACVTPCFAQTTSSDSQTLQGILAELHAMRQELNSSQRRILNAQILLARLQPQQSLVIHEMQRLDDARAKLLQTQTDQKRFTADLTRLDDSIRSTSDEAQKKRLTDESERFKVVLAGLRNTEQGLQTAQSEAELQLRTAQDTLDTLQKQINEIVTNKDQ
jgi:peptidoglycan hydrolase CwlO-like protein